ncbi:MAG: hypothetical protein ACFE7R_00020 [Candidatus Hodarchaeota archaeon]
MSTKPAPVQNSAVKTKSAEGFVIGLEIGAWAGFESGKIIVLADSKARIEFRYGQYSAGKIPKIGDRVSIDYSGDTLLEISEIRVIGHRRNTDSNQMTAMCYDSEYIFDKPKAAVAVSLTEVLVAIAMFLIGWIEGTTKPAAPYIFGIVGIAHLCIAWLAWEYTSG